MSDSTGSSERRNTGWATIPNAVTVARFLLIPPIAWLLLDGTRSWLIVALVVIFCATDWIDGVLARALNQTSRFGEILDPLADRLGIAVITVVLTIIGALPAWATVAIIAVDALVGLLAIARYHDRDRLSVSWVGKIRTAVIMVSVSVATLGAAVAGDTVSTIGSIGYQAGAALHIVAGAGYLQQLTRAR